MSSFSWIMRFSSAMRHQRVFINLAQQRRIGPARRQVADIAQMQAGLLAPRLDFSSL